MNFLELCQFTARESSVISGTQPSSVVDQTGKLGKLVNWVAEAWNDVQLARPDWFWMESEFHASSNPTASGGTGLYTAASLGITTRWSDWVRDQRLPNGTIYRPLTIYTESLGVSDERPIMEISWPSYRVKYRRGTQTENYPSEWAVSPAGEIALGAIPNDAYILRGAYRKSPQDLTSGATPNTNTPECPSQFHPIIVWRALQKMVRHDEAPPMVMAGAVKNYKEFMELLERHQLEELTVNGDPVA